MPLSEEEQKILREIEQQLSASDPHLVQQVSETTLYRHAPRAIKWSALGFLAGLALLVFTFNQSLIGGFAGFLVMLASLFVIERNVRKMSKAGIQSFTRSMPGGGVRGFVQDRTQGLRDRFRRDDA